MLKTQSKQIAISRSTRGKLAVLSQLAQPVNNLYYAGNNLLELLDRPCVAIVGSRHPSEYGEQVTRQLVEDLVAAGIVIVSGLALGIDSIAHRAAVDNGGQTVAVLPAGLDNIYPSRHRQLADQIIETGGALVTEYPEGSGPPLKYQFIARNRIIAALADAIVITEAARKSGSLHTADFGLELGIDILALPGNITSPTSGGTNKLIRSGATPVLSSADILELFAI